jgi:hypothetical protein
MRTKTPVASKGILPNTHIDLDESVNDFFTRLAQIDATPNAEEFAAYLEARQEWFDFANWLRRQPDVFVKSWDGFKKLWKAYKGSRASAPAAAASSQKGSGANMETPETLQLQPKAKAKSRAVGGSRPARPKTKKILLSQPVIPYHDIMNDGYYIK